MRLRHPSNTREPLASPTSVMAGRILHPSKNSAMFPHYSASLAYHCFLVPRAFFVVRDPFAYPLAAIEVSRTHLGSVFSEPLPIAVHSPVLHGPLAPDRSVIVMLYML